MFNIGIALNAIPDFEYTLIFARHKQYNLIQALIFFFFLVLLTLEFSLAVFFLQLTQQVFII